LLSVEIPVIEKYNEGRDPDFRIRMVRMGSTLVMRYSFKPGHNVYQLETRLVSSYPTVPPETRVLTPLKHYPHLLEGQTLCLWRQGNTLITTLDHLADGAGCNPGFTSLLLTLRRVPDVFEEAFRPYRFRVSRSAECLICQARPTPASAEDLDVALDQALARLGDE
jgi:hypothetical protein